MIKPPTFAAWTPATSGSDGLKSAVDYREKWGGWVFVSTTEPGYVAWFDLSHTPSMVLRHPLTRSHDGVLNPQPNMLRPYVVALHEHATTEAITHFECLAVDEEHAMDQASEAYPAGYQRYIGEVELPGPKDLATQLAEAWRKAG
jgi:hypothetical protein